LVNCGPIDQTVGIDVLVAKFRPIDQWGTTVPLLASITNIAG
jgi:hypothetical protein